MTTTRRLLEESRHPAWRHPVTEAMTRHAITVPREMGVRAAATLLREESISGAPVVDDNERALGIVSKTDILNHLLDEGDEETPVEDIMTTVTFSLPENASLGRAAALMAFENVHRLAITSSRGDVVGMLSALDIVGWVARQEHFVAVQQSA